MKITHYSAEFDNTTPDIDRCRHCFDQDYAYYHMNEKNEAFEGAAKSHYYGGFGAFGKMTFRLYTEGWSDGSSHIAERVISVTEERTPMVEMEEKS